MRNLSLAMMFVLAGCAVDARQDVAQGDDGQETVETTGGVNHAVASTRLTAVQPWKEVGPENTLSYPAAKVLDTSETKYFVEPEGGTKKDDAGHSYTDNNYWNMCGPGAEAVVLYHSPWRNNPKYGTINTYYSEPYGPHVSKTFWTSPSNDATYGYKTIWRPSILYLAEQSKPPVFSTAGVDDFHEYPTSGSKTSDVCDSLNWEASDHHTDTTYCGTGSYFYAQVSGASSFHSHVVNDVNKTYDGWTGWALWVAVDPHVDSSHHLPNWSHALVNSDGSHGGHAIAVVGYDDNAGTYTYIDTCGPHCNGSSGNQQSTRAFTVGQSMLHSIMWNHIW